MTDGSPGEATRRSQLRRARAPGSRLGLTLVILFATCFLAAAPTVEASHATSTQTLNPTASGAGWTIPASSLTADDANRATTSTTGAVLTLDYALSSSLEVTAVSLTFRHQLVQTTDANKFSFAGTNAECTSLTFSPTEVTSSHLAEATTAATITCGGGWDVDAVNALILTVTSIEVATDNNNDWAVDIATLSVTLRNRAPLAVDDAASTNEGSAITITTTELLSNDIEPDGEALTISGFTQPASGTVVETPASSGNLVFTPTADFFGATSFDYTLTDGQGHSDTGSVAITVSGINDPPSFTKGSDQDVAEDSGPQSVGGWATSISAGPSETQTVTFTTTNNNNALFSTQPALGPTGTLAYTPATNANGAATVSVTLADNGGTANGGADMSATQTFTITVTAVNDAPSGAADSYSTNEDTTLTVASAQGVLSNDADVEGSALTAAVVANPTKGSLTLNANGGFTYTPNADANGADSFTYKANDSAANSSTITVSLSIDPTNDVPTATAQTASTDEDTAKAIHLEGTDVDGDPLTYAIVLGPLGGALTGTAPSLTYTPNANVNGVDSFTFKVNDGTGDSAPATVNITVNAVNDAPAATTQSITATEDTPATITLAGTDPEGNAVTFTVVTGPSSGALTGTAPSLTYTPTTNYNGADSFTFKANDGTIDSTTATITITVTPTNDAPSATGQTISTNEDTAKAITLAGTDVDGDTLTVTILTQPANGVLTGTGASHTYTPDANFAGSDGFSFKVNDGTVDSVPTPVTLTVTAVNDVPIGTSDGYSTNEDTPLTIAAPGVLANDDDVEGSALTATVVTNPTKGTLALNADGGFLYTPSPNANGLDSFTYTANDGAADSSAVTVLLTINPINDLPTTTPQDVSTNEDTSKQITFGGTDVDGDALTYVVLSNPTKGALSGTAPTFTYTPNANTNGADSFTFKVNDGTGDSPNATINITIDAINDAPTATSRLAITSEDTAAAITLAGTDVEGDSLTFTILSDPTHGTLSGTAPTITYTPAANYNGPDSFTFNTNDGGLDSASATVTITVNAVNDAPTANAQSHPAAEDTAKTITLTGSDIDGDIVAFVAVTQPSNGVLTGTGASRTYTPNSNFAGTDTFTFKVNDGTVDSPTAIITIVVNAVNDAPTANPQTLASTEDTSVEFTLGASDVEGSSLTYAIAAHPTHGILTGTAPSLTYTPHANYNGPDSFTFTVNDGALDSATATITLTINPANDAPIANAQTLATNEDAALPVTLIAADLDGDTLTYALATQPTHGTLTGTAPSLTYTPHANYHGPDSFTFHANDDTADSNTATITIAINPVNDAPLATSQTQDVAEDGTALITLAGTDLEANPITFTIVAGPSHGALSGTAPDLIYSPTGDYNGPDSFTFNVNDGNLDSASATVAITVTPVNDPPTATSQTASTPEDTPKTILLGAADKDGDPLTYQIVDAPTHGTISGTAPTLTYAPAPNYNGPDSFTFRVNDGSTSSATATVTITVNAVNDPPTATSQSVSTAEETTKPIALGATDIDGNPVTFTIVTSSSHGTLTIAGADVTYTPAADYNGPDSFTFQANDGTTDGPVATITILVTAINDAPIASPQTVSTDEDAAETITLEGNDIDGDTLTFTIVDPPEHGILTGTGASRTYTPHAHYNGPDTFTFNVNDATYESAYATVTVTVNAVNDAPTASPQTVLTNEDTFIEIDFTGTDVDADALTFTVVTPPMHGELSGTGSTLTYTPATDFVGTDSFTIQAHDGTLDSAPATITITVAAVNDAPTADDDQYNVNPGATLTVTAAFGILENDEDEDGDTLRAELLTNVGNGTLTLATDGTFVYTPHAGFQGTDSFTYHAKDETTHSAPATVTIIVNPIPIVSAGADRVAARNETLVFQGTATDDGPSSELTYEWIQRSGPTTTIANATRLDASFVAPQGPVSITFELRVTDANGATGTDTVTIIVPATAVVNAPPGPTNLTFGTGSVLTGMNLTVGSGGDISISATITEETPTDLPALPSGTVAAPMFLELTVATGPGASVTSATLDFTLPRAWLDANCPIATCNVAVLHHTGTAWETLPATRLGDVTADLVSYRFTTTSFSPFVPIASLIPSGGGGGGGGGAPQVAPAEPVVNNPLPRPELPPAGLVPPDDAAVNLANDVPPAPADGRPAHVLFARNLNIFAAVAVSFLLAAGVVATIGPRRIRSGAMTMGRTAQRTAREAGHAWARTQRTVHAASLKFADAVDAKGRLRRFDILIRTVRRNVLASERRARSTLASRFAAVRQAATVAAELHRGRAEFARRTRIARREIASRRSTAADDVAIPRPQLAEATVPAPLPRSVRIRSRTVVARMSGRLERRRNVPMGLRAGLVAMVSNDDLPENLPLPLAFNPPTAFVADPVTQMFQDLIQQVDEPLSLEIADIAPTLTEHIEVIADRRVASDLPMVLDDGDPIIAPAAPGAPDPFAFEAMPATDAAPEDEAPVVKLARSLWEDVEIRHDPGERGPGLEMPESGFDPSPAESTPPSQEAQRPRADDPVDELTRATNELARNIERSWDDVKIVRDSRSPVDGADRAGPVNAPREVVWGDLSAEMNVSASRLSREKKTPRVDGDGSPPAAIVLALLLAYLLSAAANALRLFG